MSDEQKETLSDNTSDNNNNRVVAVSDELIIRVPDDFHIHLRDKQSLTLLVPHACAQFGRVLVMPNLVPPIVNCKQAQLYKDRILSNVPSNEASASAASALQSQSSFEPLMTLYLTDQTTPEDIQDAKQSGIIFAVKYYPKGATTNSENGVTNIQKLVPTLNMMSECDIPLCIHGEVTDPTVDVFDREAVFLSTELPLIVQLCPKLKIIVEHITTKEAVEFVLNAGENIAATITAHHLISNRNEIFSGGGITPHMYCLPILKTEKDRLALVSAAISGNCKFFGGSDSAPHEISTKERCHGKAGIYTGYSTVCLYAQIFEENNALSKLESFLCEFGAKFYGLKLNEGKVRLSKKAFEIPETFSYLNGKLVPYRAGKTLDWTLTTI